jgi:phosphocarrier protein FPr
MTGELKLFSPCDGFTIPIEQVPDPVFAQKIIGNGIGLDPTGSVFSAPVDGEVIQLHAAGHAVTIQTVDGAQILLHIGLDTVKLKGEGFTPLVKVGDVVKLGQALIRIDTDLIARKARSLISVLVIVEAPAYALTVQNSALVKTGDEIVSLKFMNKEPTRAHISGPKAVSEKVKVLLETGMHARPAALLVGIAKKFESTIAIQKLGKSANAKSVVALLGLEIANGDEVQFIADGPDAAQAVKELAEFLKTFEEKASVALSTPVAKREATKGAIGGVSASPGLAIGRVHQLRSETIKFEKSAAGSPTEERAKLNKALAQAAHELASLSAQVKTKTDASQAAIFAAHQELLEDPDLIDRAVKEIETGASAAFAWDQTILFHANRLAHLNNELMANRANDLRDVGRRVLRILVGKTEAVAHFLAPNSILIAENLTPSDTVQLDREKVLGFCTTTGGATSHVAILARSLGIPAIAGIDKSALAIPEDTEVVLDGDRGELRLKPSSEEKTKILKIQQESNERRNLALSQSSHSAVTLDGQTIEVAANIGGVADAKQAVELGCDGVGLLRSEFLFLERATAPSEEEQYLVYQEIADVLGARPLVIRTLDVGGDKPLQYLPIDPEENPFLGVRGIRVGFLQPEILREQLRAILRVRSKGKIHVMFPMIATIDEFRKAKAILEEERLKLNAPEVSVGIMVEVPSAALIAESFAPECDFFSIGTNDLTQYTLAMDRGHKDLAKQVDALHPSVLRLIEMTVLAAHKYKKWVGVCGGLASDLKAVPILLGLGVDELSVSIPVIPLVKSQVRETNLAEATKLAQKALHVLSGAQVRDL